MKKQLDMTKIAKGLGPQALDETRNPPPDSGPGEFRRVPAKSRSCSRS